MIKKTFLPCLLSLIVIVSICTDAEAAIVSGKISNEEGEPLPYATLYIEGSTLGTTTNIEGKYAINIEPGDYYMVFQYVGYHKERIKISIKNTNLKLDVVLKAEALTLREVVVNATDEDPAYDIIRETIKRKKRFSEEINAYQCQVYMKGLQRLDERPAQILGVQIPIDTGIVYLSESVSELTFQRPDKVSERMISSKVSGSQSSFSFNQASQTLFSVYDNILTVDGLTERGFVSPLAKNAFFFYDYKLEGVISEGDHLINKIRVYPKRKADPTFEGYLYIIEDLWRVSSLELTLTKEHQMEFLDVLTVKQVHAPVADSTWVMFSQNFEFYLNTFGFKGSGYFSAIYSDYRVELNPTYYQKRENPSIQIDSTARPKKLKSFNKNDVKNEILKIEKGSNERNDEYWDKVRPIPLTAIEKKDYQIKGQFEQFKKTSVYKDSTDKIHNRITLGKLAYSGYRYHNSVKQYSLSTPALYQFIQYNTVEGILFNLRVKYSQQNNGNTIRDITPELRYGLASDHLYGQLKYKQYLNRSKFEELSIHGGHFVRQFNGDNPITPLINSISTMVFRNNYIKLYESTFMDLGYQQELLNGFFIKPRLLYAQRNELTNNTDYSWFFREKKDFTPNTPEKYLGTGLPI
ncbi:DUF5686 and carboxypeptidase regulatory-like domain-containing protein [Reichenbachiella agarivorans]|uniref:DUF5686 and carboxypeptidase regulatory-like domain-containing protein n=1 Tax=Reichenbachiella agarivorans TaxID=2979464 RepID=A0ABY6CRS6_9BACT|nr:DUF5686 and carboxypeptidase regulatory-like domain-containing protein [Reichenbachiella agarivorans]UXP32068.1 DUF5686 and carboxypeptidase regulatory-like domain-containing protein [Reichenbachiella agarivorans]